MNSVRNCYMYLSLFFIFIDLNFLLLFYYSCPNFSPFALLCPAHSPLPQSVPTVLSTSVGHSYVLFDQPLPLLSTIISLPCPFWSLSICSIFTCIFYFVHQLIFVHQVPVIGEIAWCLSFTTWLISFSIIISSSIHAIMKGRNFFLLSTA